MTYEHFRLVLAFAAVLADAQLPSAGDALQVVGALGGTGFAVWYAYHTTTKTIPNLNEIHAATIKEVNQIHAAAIQRLTDQFSATVTKVQNDAREETRTDRHLYRNESNVRHLEMQALTAALEELLEKLGHPGALKIATHHVVIDRGGGDSDPTINEIKAH